MMKIVLMLFFGSSLYAQTVIDREKFAKVASIESFPASGEEKGIIFLIPQVHAHPIRGYDDDPYAIVAVQSQIDDILRVLSAEYGVKTVGLEGEGEGEVSVTSSTRLQLVKKTVDLLRECLDAVDAFEALLLASSLEQDLKISVEKHVSGLIDPLLQYGANAGLYIGAGYFASAVSGGRISLHGMEDLALNRKAVQVAEKMARVYERMEKLLEEQKISPDENRSLDELLKTINTASDSMSGALKSIQRSTLVETQLLFEPRSEIFQKMEKVIGCYDQLPRAGQQPVMISSPNPYQEIKDPAELDRIFQEVKREFDEAAVAPRSDFAVGAEMRFLEERQGRVGAVIFGSGHQEEMVSGFRQGGYRVVVVTPNSIAGQK